MDLERERKRKREAKFTVGQQASEAEIEQAGPHLLALNSPTRQLRPKLAKQINRIAITQSNKVYHIK